jgi:hypothetical protein
MAKAEASVEELVGMIERDELRLPPETVSLPHVNRLANLPP